MFSLAKIVQKDTTSFPNQIPLYNIVRVKGVNYSVVRESPEWVSG